MNELEFISFNHVKQELLDLLDKEYNSEYFNLYKQFIVKELLVVFLKNNSNITYDTKIIIEVLRKLADKIESKYIVKE